MIHCIEQKNEEDIHEHEYFEDMSPIITLSLKIMTTFVQAITCALGWGSGRVSGMGLNMRYSVDDQVRSDGHPRVFPV